MSTPKRPAGKSRKFPRKRPGPEGGTRDLNRRAQTAQICDAALALFLANGVEAVTIDQIVERAGIAKGSFYRYATGKPDLVAQLLAPVIADVNAALDACDHGLRTSTSLAATYGQLAQSLSIVVARDTPRVLLYLQESRAPVASVAPAVAELADALASRSVDLTRVARHHGLIRDLDPEVSALAVLGAIEALLFTHLRRRHTPPSEAPRIIGQFVEIVLRGIRA